MQIYNTLNFNLLCDFFALMQDMPTAIPDLQDNTIYLICVTEEWGSAVASLGHNIETSQFRDCWHYKFKVERLVLDEVFLPDSIKKHIEAGYNTILPLNTPDKETKSYMLCKVNEPAHLELCAALMMVDAQTIQDKSAMDAFVKLYNDDKEKAFDEWSRMLDYKCAKPFDVHSTISFKGKYASAPSKYPFMQHEYTFPKNLKTDYEDHLARIAGISGTIKKLDKPQSNHELETAEKDFQLVVEGLTLGEKHQLLLELSKAIPAKRLSDIWNSVANRKQKGEKTKVGIEVRMKLPVLDNGSPDRLQGDVRTYLVDQNGQYHLLNFANNSATIIYIANLLFYKQGNSNKSLDIPRNELAFRKLYELVYLCDGKEAFDKLMCRISKTEVDYEGKAKSRVFNSIANCITEKCRLLGINPSAYIVSDEIPLAINPTLIKFAPELEEELGKITFNE